jgi:hypothetical protein
MKKIFKSKGALLLIILGLSAVLIKVARPNQDSDLVTKTIDQPERSWNVVPSIGPFSNLQMILSLQKK